MPFRTMSGADDMAGTDWRHDTINRDCYVPGIALAVRHAMAHKGQFTQGLERILGLT